MDWNKFEVDIDLWSLAHFFGSAFLVFLLTPFVGKECAAIGAFASGYFWEVLDWYKPTGAVLFHVPIAPDWIQDGLNWLANGLFASNGKFGLADLALDLAGCLAAHYLLT